MTGVELLKALKVFCEEHTDSIILPTAIQRGDTKITERCPEVHLMRLPEHEEKSFKKYAPYIILQLVSGKDEQKSGQPNETVCTVRFLFCVYSENDEDGAVALLNVMEAVRIALLRNIVIDNRFKLNMEKGLEFFPYLDDTAPYFAGELVGDFHMMPIRREHNLIEA